MIERDYRPDGQMTYQATKQLSDMGVDMERVTVKMSKKNPGEKPIYMSADTVLRNEGDPNLEANVRATRGAVHGALESTPMFRQRARMEEEAALDPEDEADFDADDAVGYKNGGDPGYGEATPVGYVNGRPVDGYGAETAIGYKNQPGGYLNDRPSNGYGEERAMGYRNGASSDEDHVSEDEITLGGYADVSLDTNADEARRSLFDGQF